MKAAPRTALWLLETVRIGKKGMIATKLNVFQLWFGRQPHPHPQPTEDEKKRVGDRCEGFGRALILRRTESAT